MKILFACSLLVLTTVYLSLGQDVKPSLSNDANFKQSLLKLARYPKKAQDEGKVARVYVDFKIDSQGRVTDVDLLNKNSVDASFKEAVGHLMEQLPAQMPTYAGEYVLPVAFTLDSEREGIHHPTQADRTAFDRTFVQLLHTKSLLDELSVTAYIK